MPALSADNNQFFIVRFGEYWYADDGNTATKTEMYQYGWEEIGPETMNVWSD